MNNALLATVAYIILFNCIDFHILPNELDSVLLHSTLYISNPIHSYNNKFPIKNELGLIIINLNLSKNINGGLVIHNIWRCGCLKEVDHQ